MGLSDLDEIGLLNVKADKRVFISYAPGDEIWKDRLVTLLASLQKQELLDLYPVGGSYEGIDELLERVRVAVLLLSKNYLESGFVVGPEVGPILDRRVELGLELIPVIVRPCKWEHIGRLTSRRSWPRFGAALSEMPAQLVERELRALAAALASRSRRGERGVGFDARTPLALLPSKLELQKALKERSKGRRSHPDGPGSQPSSPPSETFLDLAESGPPAPLEPRWLQGQVYEEERSGWRRRIGSFRAGTRHQIRLRIGPGDDDWMGVQEPFDETPLPEQEEFHRLEVILASTVLPESIQLRSVQLPAGGGPSTEARFEVTVPEELDVVEVSITVLYENQHLQAGLLRGRVTSETDDPEAGESILLLPGQASRVDFAGSSTRDSARISNTQPSSAPPDLSLQLSSNVVVVSSGQGKVFSVPLVGLEKLIRVISEKLKYAAGVAAQLGAERIDQGEGLALLRTLAAQGRFLRNLLLFYGGLPRFGHLARIRRVQVVSPFSAEYLPVEFFYDGPAPNEDAQLCDHFESAAGGDSTCGHCRALSDGGRFVCPLLFWGLNRIIERQVRAQPTGRGETIPCSTQVEPAQGEDALGRLQRILLASSNRVSEADQIATLKAARAIDPEAQEAEDWDEWKDWAEKAQPGLLVVLPHSVTTSLDFEALEIGDRELLRLDEVDTRWPSSKKAAPVVLLLGCNTALAEITYQDFIDRIRCRGAAVVVGTLTSVLGQHSAPVAREFLRQLSQGDNVGPSTFGEVMRRIRRRMLRAGNVMALALVAYGSSEWRLKGSSEPSARQALGLATPV